ncbi:hypothetical protein quinque_005226 [Culex quinquefasciatus]|uniref:Peroxisomal membrane protein PMP34 n=3 Tax=Culex pipiens TaxID=7175 RepID=A0A8D8L111_CULPI|nr:peroxisomal membrane protein PMP34 [Culex quinquefasciatus]
MAQSKPLNQVFSYLSWVHAVSGATGSVIAMSAFYPLDTVRSRLQLEEPERRKALSTWEVLKQLIAEEGFNTLYRGIVPVLQSLCISNFVYFYTFHSMKALRAAADVTPSALSDLLLGSLAGVVNVFSTTPFWVVNTRLKMKGLGHRVKDNSTHYDNLLDGLMYIGRTEGAKGLWAGALPSLLLVTNPAIQFMVYESLKRRLLADGGRNVSSVTFFAIGAVAKAVATVLTYPLQVIQTKLRHGNTDKSLDLPPDTDMLQMLLVMLKKQGLAGLFRGLEAKLLQTVLTAALMFMTYEKIARFVTTLLVRGGGPRK